MNLMVYPIFLMLKEFRENKEFCTAFLTDFGFLRAAPFGTHFTISITWDVLWTPLKQKKVTLLIARFRPSIQY